MPPSTSSAPPFHPHPLLRHPHSMTIVPRIWPRGNLLQGFPFDGRLFEVDTKTQLLGLCHWQSDKKTSQTVVLLHGLEGCSESHYMRGLTAKAWRAGFNVVRLNQRNCGGTEHLTPTLYHSGLSEDYKKILTELANVDGLERIWMIGYSMGGNLVLKMAGEIGANVPALQGVMAVCPNIEPGVCVTALEQPSNWIYQRYFLTRLKARLERKAALFPGKFDTSLLPRIRTMREFDHQYTAPDGGFTSAEDYYHRAGAGHVLSSIQVPTLIIAAQNDPFIPYPIFTSPNLRENPWIRLIAPQYGGHCGFIQRRHPGEDAYWAENRLIDFMKSTNDVTQTASARLENFF